MTLREIVNEKLIYEENKKLEDDKINEILKKANNDITDISKENIDEDQLIKALKIYFNNNNKDIDLKKIKVFSSPKALDDKGTYIYKIEYDGDLLKICKKKYIQIRNAKLNPLEHFIKNIGKSIEKINKDFKEKAEKDPEGIKKQVENFLETSMESAFNIDGVKAELQSKELVGTNTIYTVTFFYNGQELITLNNNSIKNLIDNFINHSFENAKQIEAKAREILKKETKEIFEKNGHKFSEVKNSENFNALKDELSKSVIITTMPCGVSYKENGETINVSNGRSVNKSPLASNGVDSYITIPGNIRIGVESKAHESDRWDPITPILYLIFNNKNNNTNDDYVIGLIDGGVINQLKKNNLDYSVSGKTIFIGDQKFEKNEYRMALKNAFKGRTDWIQTDGSGKTKYILNNISIPKIGINIIRPILGHDEYINTIIKPLSEKYDCISQEIISAKGTYKTGYKSWMRHSDKNVLGAGAKKEKNNSVDTSNIKPSVDNVSIINNLIETVEKLKKTCEIINKNFNTTIGTEYIKKFNIILNRLNGINNQKNIITGNWDKIGKSQEKNTKNDYEEYANAASVKTKYFNY